MSSVPAGASSVPGGPPPVAAESDANGTGHQRKHPASEPPNTEDVLFVNHLSSAGLLGVLDQRELRRVAGHLSGRGLPRRCDLLELYYRAGGNTQGAAERQISDRFFGLNSDDLLSAQDVVARIAAVNPEIEDAALERIGAIDGPLVLRCKQHIVAVEDEDEIEETEDETAEGTSDFGDTRDDLRPTVSVRSLIYATNRLLRQAKVKDRMVALSTDDWREFYVGLSLQSALALVREELLDHAGAEAMMEFADW